jgi:acyl-CoA hydrolase
MADQKIMSWKKKIVSPEDVLEHVEPGMSIFVGTGMAEPRTLVKHLMASDKMNLQDLEMIQLISLGDTPSIDARYSKKYRLKTFGMDCRYRHPGGTGRSDPEPVFPHPLVV